MTVITDRERPAFDEWCADIKRHAAEIGQDIPRDGALESYFVGRYSVAAALRQDAIYSLYR